MRRKWSTVRVESPEALAQALDSIRQEWPLFWFACDQAETFGIFLLQESATGAGTLFFPHAFYSDFPPGAAIGSTASGPTTSTS